MSRLEREHLTGTYAALSFRLATRLVPERGDPKRGERDGAWPGSESALVPLRELPILNLLRCCFRLDTEVRVVSALWVANLVCFLVHTAMALAVLAVVLGLESTDELAIPLKRVTTVWNSSKADGFKLDLADGGHLRIDVLTACFFALSAAWHLWAVVLPMFPSEGSFGWLYVWASKNYYGGIDRCSCPHRWLEYSISASVMIMAIRALGGIRERITIVLVFLNMSFCQLFGYLGERMAGGPLKTPAGPDYRYWKGEVPSLDGEDPPKNPPSHRFWTVFGLSRAGFFTCSSPKSDDNFEARSNRLLFWRIGFVPYMLSYGIVIGNFIQSTVDLSVNDPDLWRRVPEWVYAAILVTFLIFSSFAVPQAFFFQEKPREFYKTELWYCFLSLLAKVYLGLLLLTSVIRFGSYETAVAPD